MTAKIGHIPVTALLDSGANVTVLGNRGIALLKNLKLIPSSTTATQITTADGATQTVIGSLNVPISLNGISKIFSVVLVPSVRHTLILGVDFCRAFGISINFKTGSFSTRGDICTLNGLSGSDQLTQSQRQALNNVIQKYQELGSKGLGRTPLVEHVIDTGDAAPTKQRQYPLSPPMMEHLNKELDSMIERDIVQPSVSPWSSPVLLVKKSSGDYRLCFDGRKINSVTVKDAYPLPRVDSILNKLRDAKFLSSIDLKSAFWQIPLHKNSCEKTAFSVPGRGLFEFKRMAFGLCNAPQTLQRLMDNILGPELEPNVFVYLDDCIIVTQTFEEHLCILYEVLNRLEKAGLTINFEKCEFCRPSLKYLGYLVDCRGLRTDPDKVSAIVEFPRPTTVTEVKRFMGILGWYRRFVPNFASLAAPINDLTKGRRKKNPIKWSPEAEDSFLKLKLALTSAPVLASPNYSTPLRSFRIYTDASNFGVGAILTQEDDNNVEHPIAFMSRTLNKAERNYSVTERECLAVVFAIDKFRPYLEGLPFTVITDHYSLLWLMRMSDPTGKLARWAVKLQQFPFTIEHRPGKLNALPDALSRAPLEIAPINNVDFSNTKDNSYIRLRDRLNTEPDLFPDWRVENDLIYKRVDSPYDVPSNLSAWKLLVPRDHRNSILQECHDDPSAAHLGIFKTYHRIIERYYWPKMRTSIARYVKQCKVCLAQKVPQLRPPGLMGKEKIIKFPWQAISVDLMGPLPKSLKGHQYILAVSDWFTKFPLLFPLREATAPKICQLLEEHVFLLFGVPQIVMVDNGTQFVSDKFRNLMTKYSVPKIWYNAKFHPQVNFVERTNRTVKTAIRSYVQDNHRKWDENLSALAQAIRTAVHEVTGFSPSFLNFARHVPLSGNYYHPVPELVCSDKRENYANPLSLLSEFYQTVQSRIHAAHKRNERYYNLRRRPLEFYEGETVWKKNYVLSAGARYFSSKLAPRFIECTVSKKISKTSYRLRDQQGTDLGIWHIKDLKPAPNVDLTDNSED